MKFRVRMPLMNAEGQIIVSEIPYDQIAVSTFALLSIDGSTSNSGLAIIRESDGAIMYIMCATREKGETVVQYKVRLKRVIKEILHNNRAIQQTYYEEPVVANITAVKGLFTLRTFIEELIVEEEPDLDYIKHYEVSNMRWKKEILAPDKVPQGTEKQKKAVRDKLVSALPFLESSTQDELDAIGLGFAAAKYLSMNKGGEELQSKKKTRPFKYNVQFMAADDDDSMLEDFMDVYKGPEKLLQNGISLTEIKSKTNFDKHIYETMGPDDDKVLIIKFPSRQHGDLILKYRIGELSASFDYIYAIVWRATRK